MSARQVKFPAWRSRDPPRMRFQYLASPRAIFYLLEIEDASQDVKTATATLQNLQHQEVPIVPNDHQPSVLKRIVTALIALLLALFGYGINDTSREEEAKGSVAVTQVLLECKKAEKRIKRAEAHMRALDRLVEAQQLDLGDNGTGSWETLER
ncbi:hypothetical protein FANTH_8880 [Fusarium anthophilum]|uniref:Uncharacterized protein n=1 Tax=Fusarium anthophilum TaxID=48485 RepID=A0A8H5DZX7_9HYPO|nr:hypothetical protein FANTH_8880 [Fusarium anthophilum]